eukprot:gene30770-40065_t
MSERIALAATSANATTIKGRRPKISSVQNPNHGKQQSQKLIQITLYANPLERLCKLLLPWKILDLSSKENVLADSSGEVECTFNHIPILFQTYQQYVDAFEPLMIEEMKAGILSNLKSGEAQTSHCQFSVLESFEKVGELTVLETDFKISDRVECPQVYDVIIISKDPVFTRTASAYVENEVIYTVAIVVNCNSISGNKVYQLKTFTKSWNSLQESIPPNAVDKKTTQDAKIRVFRLLFTYVDNLRSVWREFQGLHQIGCNPAILQEILGANRVMTMATTPPLQPSDDFSASSSLTIGKEFKSEIYSVGLPTNFVKYVNSSFNSSQIEAICTSVADQGFTLIQGPPGTGKTSTLIGILNAIHLREYNKYYTLALSTILGPEGLKCRQSINPNTSWLNLAARLSKLKPHILVTAPSNIAVDNVIQRIIDRGFVDGNGGRYNPNILRVGGGKSDSVKIVSLEETIEKESAFYANSSKSNNPARQSKLQSLQERIRCVVKESMTVQSYLFNLKTAYDISKPLPPHYELRVSPESGLPYWVDHLRKTTSLEPPNRIKLETNESPAQPAYTYETLPEYIMHSHRMTQLITELEALSLKNARMQAFTTGGGSAVARQLIESSIIDEAELLFTTLNGAGHSSLDNTSFCVVVVDEAAQCVEPSILIPLRRGCTHCIMVGDQNQLPATIFSNKVKAFGYDRSLFDRLICAGNSFVLLNTQYRMHPSISEFPSRQFYGGELLDGQNVLARGDELSSSQSRVNLEEVRFCCRLVECLLMEANRFQRASPGSIGIITPYSEQQQKLRSEIGRRFQCSHNKGGVLDIEVNTVDGFQGKEKDIIIISTVRGNDNGSIGFLSDKRRMNVALTRAKLGLFVVGHAATLSQCNIIWRDFVNHADKNGVLIWCENSTVDITTAILRSGSHGTVDPTDSTDNSSGNIGLQYGNATTQIASLNRRRQKSRDKHRAQSSSTSSTIITNTISRAEKRPRIEEVEEGEINEDVVEF